MRMKSVMFAGCSAVVLAFPQLAMAADDWVLRVETSSRACHVQLKTAAPLGKDFFKDQKTYSSRKAACQEAAKQYDSSLSDTNKCWTYGRGTTDSCKKDGVDLQPKK